MQSFYSTASQQSNAMLTPPPPMGALPLSQQEFVDNVTNLRTHTYNTLLFLEAKMNSVTASRKSREDNTPLGSGFYSSYPLRHFSPRLATGFILDQSLKKSRADHQKGKRGCPFNG
eukprot:TRINITY_DN1802_c0_g1_i1.p1 TRINITY_DN1802_c0_g1~~TRINITY_DN1802_c0_g1_i1.p1  ORF type:complete len:116 (+),score=19.47 TRINITY_DN1802_c0_g1_i1:293-640(+)